MTKSEEVCGEHRDAGPQDEIPKIELETNELIFQSETNGEDFDL